MSAPADRPRTGGECKFRFPDGSCSEHRDVKCGKSSKACARGVKARPADPQAEQGVLL